MIYKLPKPHPIIPQPKPERLPKRKAMTLIAGFPCSDGILICADREESDGYARRAVHKITSFNLKNSNYVIAGAGRSSILSNAIPRIEMALRKAEECGDDLLETHRSIIGNSLQLIHEELIWSSKDPEASERFINLIIAASFETVRGEVVTALYGTDKDIVSADFYVFKGIGSDLAHYFADKLFVPSPNDRIWSIILATFIFREVRESIEGVGLGTEMVFLSGRKRGLRHEIGYEAIHDLEDGIISVRDALSTLWNNRVKLPVWLTEMKD